MAHLPKKKNKQVPEVLLRVTEDFYRLLSVKPETASIRVGDENFIFVISDSLILDLETLMIDFFASTISPNSPPDNNNSEWLEFPAHFCYDLGRSIGFQILHHKLQN